MVVADGEVEILRLGARGDGVAAGPEGPVYVPFSLPGETWRLGEDGEAVRMTDGPDRVAPVCPHFLRCGGCTMQHLALPVYASWKREIVATALAQHGLDVALSEMRTVPLASRRRAVLTAVVERGDARLGFHEARSHDVVDLDVCPVLRPEIVNAFGALRELAVLLAKGLQPLRLSVLASEAGLDVDVAGARDDLGTDARGRLAELTERADWARLSLDGDVVVLRRRPILSFGGVPVVPPPGVFVQAVREAQEVMQEIVVRAAGRAKHIADLFAGIGTLTLPLAKRGRVSAIDSDAAALGALEVALRESQGLKPVEAKVRDLYATPLARKELEAFDCVVFDPPRAGAKAQAEWLAKSRVPVVVAVSCNPSTLARDLRILADGGYTIESVTPVDQFVFSPHVEVVAVARRAAGGRRR